MKALKYYFLIIILFIIIYSFSNTTNNTFYYPIKNNKNISSYFGYRTLNNNTHFHNGIDIPATNKTKVHAISNGIVLNTGFSNVYGIYVTINHSNGYRSFYAHLDEDSLVTSNDYIYANQIIGYIGKKYLNNGKQNGMTTGPHLHFSVFLNKKATNPLNYTYIY